MTPLKFLHLTTFYPPYSFGGDAMYIYRLCHALADEGHQVDVVHSVDAYRVAAPGASRSAVPRRIPACGSTRSTPGTAG